MFGRIILNDFAFYFCATTQKGSFTKSKLKWKKKNVPICSRWFGLLFILVLASDECPSVLCLTKAATFAWQASKMRPPPPGSLQAMCATDQALFQELIWSREKKTTPLQDFALLERQAQNRGASVFQLITNELENSCLDDFVTFSAVT